MQKALQASPVSEELRDDHAMSGEEGGAQPEVDPIVMKGLDRDETM